MKYIKIFGAERSGVGFLAELLRRNAKNATIVTDGLGIRYKPPLTLSKIKQFLKDNKFYVNKDTARIIRVLEKKSGLLIPISVIKNPYSCYKSISRFRPGHSVNLDKEFDNYNELYKSCISMLFNNTMDGYDLFTGICYENLINNENLMKILTHLSETYDIEFKEDIEIPVEIEPTYPFTDAKRSFYLSGSPYKLDTDTMNRITLAVDWDIAHKFFNYAPLDPREVYSLGKVDVKRLTAYMRSSGILRILKLNRPKP